MARYLSYAHGIHPGCSAHHLETHKLDFDVGTSNDDIYPGDYTYYELIRRIQTLSSMLSYDETNQTSNYNIIEALQVYSAIVQMHCSREGVTIFYD